MRAHITHTHTHTAKRMPIQIHSTCKIYIPKGGWVSATLILNVLWGLYNKCLAVLSDKVTQSWNISVTRAGLSGNTFSLQFPWVSQLLPPSYGRRNACMFSLFFPRYEIRCHRHRSSNRKHWRGNCRSFGILSQETLNFLLLAPKTTSLILWEHGCCARQDFCFLYPPSLLLLMA